MPLNQHIYQSKLSLKSLWTRFSSISNVDSNVNSFFIGYPKVTSYFTDLTEHQESIGKPFHNLTDIVRQYRFEDVNKIKVVVTSKSEFSQFDFAVQLSLFSTYHNFLVKKYWKFGALGLGVLFLIYCCHLFVTYKRKTDDRNYQDMDEEYEEDGQEPE